jgi:hypothetical protein
MLKNSKNGGENSEETRGVEIWPGIWAYRTESVVERVLQLNDEDDPDEDARSDDDEAQQGSVAGAQ